MDTSFLTQLILEKIPLVGQDFQLLHSASSRKKLNVIKLFIKNVVNIFPAGDLLKLYK